MSAYSSLLRALFHSQSSIVYQYYFYTFYPFDVGLRGAVAFALAMRNTESVPRQMMLTSVLVVVLVTVIFNGGATMSVLSALKIR